MQKSVLRHLISTYVAVLLITILPLHGKSAWADSATTVEGWFSILWGDGTQGSGETEEEYILTDAAGQSILLELDQNVLQLEGGVLGLDRKYIAAQGDMAQGRVFANTLPVMMVSSLNLLSPPWQVGEEASLDQYQAVSGAKPWVSIMCKFSDYAVEPKNLAYFQTMYSSTKPGFDHYWRELSYNTLNVGGSNAFGWFTLPHPESYYNPSDTQGGANLDLLFNDCVAAADASVNFSSFAGINMMFNTNFDNGYAWGGGKYATLDGVFKLWYVTWEPPWGYEDITVIAHEMGHGFGLPHSSGMYGQTYDNKWDVMSDTWSNCSNSSDSTYGCLGQHTISYHKDKLGWIPTGGKLVTGTTNISVTVDNIALQSTSNYRMIQIPLDGTTIYYTVEVRQKSGYDVKLPAKAVIIHEVDPSRLRPAYVVDIDNDGDTGDAGAMWTVGETYTHPGGDFAVAIIAETSNGFQVSVTFADPDPDLIVESPGVSSQMLAPGQAFSIFATVANQGAGQADSSILRYYRSTDAAITAGDTFLGTDSIPTLSQGEISAQSLSTSAPATAGIYYVGACIDSVSNESATDNNCSTALQITVLTQNEPDLIVQSPAISDSTPEPQQSITLSATVRNQGTLLANSTTLRYFRSIDATITTTDSEIGGDPVSSLGPNSTSPESLTFNAPTTPGIYYYGACVDTVSAEIQTANNCSSALMVTVATSGAADLIVQSAAISDSTPEPRQSITLSSIVRNQGTLTANSTTLRYFRSSNAAIATTDSEIGSDPVSSLGPSGTSPESLTFNAPAAPGTYYYGACVNVVSGETQTGNNCSAGLRVTVSLQPKDTFPWAMFLPVITGAGQK